MSLAIQVGMTVAGDALQSAHATARSRTSQP